MSFDVSSSRPMSMTLRLTLLIGLAISVLLIALGWRNVRAIERHFVEQDAEELAVVFHALLRVLEAMPDTAPAEDKRAALARAVQGHHGMYYFVAEASGTPIFTMPGPKLAPLTKSEQAVAKIDPDTLRVWQEGEDRYRGAVLGLQAGKGRRYVAVIATGMSFHEHFLGSFRQTMWLGTIATALLAILVSWLAVRKGLRPLSDMSQRISHISANELHVRLEPQRVPVELEGLTQSFNAMLERVGQDFRRLSNFSADIAHELRTPLTNLITQTQVLLSQPRDADAYKEVHYANLEEFERMAKMIGDMLYLAQTDNRLIKPEWSEVDLNQEVDDLMEYFEPWADERQVPLRREGRIGAVFGDRLMLRRALSNLLANAIRHTQAGKAVTVRLHEAGALVHIRVENPGAPIDPLHLPHLFDRFYRVDPSRQRNGDGAGLGLAIVKSIIEAHAGTVSVSCSDGTIAFDVALSSTLP